MTDACTSPGRHLVGLLATAMLAGAFAALAGPEILGAARPDATRLLVLAALALSGPALGIFLVGRLPRRPPLDRLARTLGLVGLAMPLAVLAARAGHQPLLDGLPVPVVSLAGGWLTGLLFGLALAAVFAGAGRHPRLCGRPGALAVLLAAAVLAGIGFTRYVAGPRLSALNIALDLTLGCAVIGIICTTGTPGANRRLETWLSVLALVAILALPLSGVLDDVSRHWADPAVPVAAQVRPAAS